MESLSAVYVRVANGNSAALEEAIRSVRSHAGTGPLGVLQYDPSQHEFALVDRWGRSDDIPFWNGKLDTQTLYAELSKIMGEVLAYFTIEEGSELTEYAHWKDGALVRCLSFTDNSWDRVEGTPQAWEPLLFTQKRLDAVLQYADDDGTPTEKVRAAFAHGSITEGSPWPSPGYPNGIISAVCAGLRAPLPGFQPWPRRRDVVSKL